MTTTRATSPKCTLAELALHFEKLSATNCGPDEAIATFTLGRLGITKPTTAQVVLVADVLEAYALLLQANEIQVCEGTPCRTNTPF